MPYGVIYGLYDPRTHRLRYVGQTTKSLAIRLTGHLCPSSLRQKSHVYAWLRKLIRLGLRPSIQLLSEADNQTELDNLEIRLIAEARARGEDLTNISNGGSGSAGHTVSTETREKIAAAQRGVPRPKHTAEWKARMSALMAGRCTNPPEHYIRIAELKRGSTHSPEVRARISAAKKGQMPPNKGVPMGVELRARISASRKGKSLGATHPQYRDDIATGEILRLLGSDMTKVQVAAYFKVSPTFIHRRLAEAQREGLEIPKTRRTAWNKGVAHTPEHVANWHASRWGDSTT